MIDWFKPSISSEKTIVFKARSRTESRIQDRPYPASKALPDWWKNASPYAKTIDDPAGKTFLLRNREANATFKRCTPLLDGMATGYIIPLWADIQVTQQGLDFPLVTWRTRHDIFELHGDPSREIPAPAGYDQIVYKYLNAWIPQTPKGYSCLVVSPLGYQNLPFKAVPAIVDTDKSTFELVFPVWIKTGLEGIVEAGTPMAQIIPFKRDEWRAEFDTYEDGEYYQVIEESTFNKHVLSHYKQNVWSKKRFS